MLSRSPPSIFWSKSADVPRRIRRMSAFGYKRTSRDLRQSVRFAPESRHSDSGNRWDGESGHWMSALPPKADIGAVKSRQRPSDVCFNKPDANGPAQTAIHDRDQKHATPPEGSTKSLGPWGQSQGPVYFGWIGGKCPGTPLIRPRVWVPSREPGYIS